MLIYLFFRSALITWRNDNVWIEVRSISRSGNAIIRRTIRFSREDLRILLEQSRRLLLEVTVEQQQHAEPKPTAFIPTLKRCATEICGLQDEGYASDNDIADPECKMIKTDPKPSN
jgi:hypothetical protein